MDVRLGDVLEAQWVTSCLPSGESRTDFEQFHIEGDADAEVKMAEAERIAKEHGGSVVHMRPGPCVSMPWSVIREPV